MLKNSYDIRVNGRTLRDFEFIVGPMSALSIPQPPRPPEEFILAAFQGGATPIVAARQVHVDAYIEDIKVIKKRMGERHFGANILGLWRTAEAFIKEFIGLRDESPGFLDINALELDLENFLPLIREIKVPVYIGISQPVSLYALGKLLRKKEYSFLIDRFAAKTLKLYVPRNRGGGHLPILLKGQAEVDWLDELVKEVVGIEEAIQTRIPLIIEKGMLTVGDFVTTIVKYSQDLCLCGIRFASNLELTRECGLNRTSKELLAEIVRQQKREMIIPIRGNFAASRKGSTVRGGYVTYVVATRMARKIHEMQCEGKDFPRYRRTFRPDVLMDQATETEMALCHLCLKDCPMEFCELKGAWDSVAEDGNIDQAIINISPRIVELDPRYIDASAAFVVRDMIEKTLARIRSRYAEVATDGRDLTPGPHRALT